MSKKYDPSTLQSFGNVAAGHEGVLSDPSGAVVIKPCTPAEISFYESVSASHPELLPHLPTYMGTLSLSDDQQEEVAASSEGAADTGGTIETESGKIERLHGKKLDTELHIVLENITHGFKKPNILDLKLGKQLWDENAKPEKRARLDEVSAATTSGSLGFRIAGMRTWKQQQPPGEGVVPQVDESLQPYVERSEETGYWIYNKMYGRKFSAQDVDSGFEAYILPQGGSSSPELQRAREVLAYFLGEVKDVQEVFEKMESRMYSASILLVYEGDLEEYAQTKRILASGKPVGTAEEEEDLPKLAEVKMIDFAHATWRPGEGPDENALMGMRSTAGILKRLLDRTEGLLGGDEDEE